MYEQSTLAAVDVVVVVADSEDDVLSSFCDVC
jgi:hypothetical protein